MKKQFGYIYRRAGFWVLRYRENVIENGQVVRKQLAKRLAPIAPEHRRRRLASCLLERVEDGFRRRHARIARLEVRATNVPAQKLYLSLGYTVTQRLPKYYSNGGDGLLMVKPLD